MREDRAYLKSEIRAKGGDSLGITGHAAVFNELSEDLGGWKEIIRAGAFAEAIKRDDVRFLIEHQGSALARNVSGTMRLTEDSVGLHVDADFDGSDPDVQRLMPKIRRGDLSQMSFGFIALREDWRFEGGLAVRELVEAQLFDVSAVSFPAYVQTDIAARSAAQFAGKIAELRSRHLQSTDPNIAAKVLMTVRRERNRNYSWF